MATVKFNNDVKLIISDVDETIAGVYTDADPDMVHELEKLLEEKRIIFMITGQGLREIQRRITDKIDKHLRKGTLIAHCSGAEVRGFDNKGEIFKKPYTINTKQFFLNHKRINGEELFNSWFLNLT